MSIRNSNITLINGPGRHGKYIESALKTSFNNLIVFDYYPRFKQVSYPGLNSSNSSLMDLSEKITGGIEARLNLKNRWNEIVQYELYDLIVSKRLSAQDLLIAWPQMSLSAIKKAQKYNTKVWLEFPIIHIKEHQKILKDNYRKKNLTNTFDVFPTYFEKKILKEIKLSDKINVLSTYAKESFLKHGVPEDKLIVTPLGIDTNQYSLLPEIKKEGPFKILFVGRVNYWKGIDNLLKAFSLLPKDSELWLVGPVQKEIAPIFKNHNLRIKILGEKSGADLIRLYNEADVKILPSLQESFGLVILEAMACGTPVITSKYCAGPDIICSKEHGFIIEPENIDDIYEKLHLVYKSLDYYRHFSSRNTIRNYIESSYSLNNYQKALVDNINNELR